MITVRPQITFDLRPDGLNPNDLPQWLPDCKDDIGHRPTVVDDLEIKWGRDGYYDDVSPTEMTVRLWDSTGEYARMVRDNTGLGRPIETWCLLGTGDDPRNFLAERIFHGAVSGIHAQRMHRRDQNNRPMWYVTLTCHDPLSQMANIYPLPGVLKRGERMFTRKDWLLQLIRDYGGADVTDLQYQPAYINALCWEYEVGESAADQILQDFYGSMSGDAFCYDAMKRSIEQCERHDWSFTQYLASYGDNVGAVLISASDANISNITRPGIAIPACNIDVGDGMEVEASPDTYINRAETKFKTIPQTGDNAGKLTDSTMSSERIHVGQARRLLSNDSWFKNDWDIQNNPDQARGLLDLQHRSMWDRATQEGARPRHSNLVWHAGKEFTDARTARWWIKTRENVRPGFINGDEEYRWLTDGQVNYEFPPIVSPLGGTITYNGGDGWDFDLSVQWVRNRNTTLTPITWSKLPQYQFTTEQESVPWWWDIIGLPKPPKKRVGERTPERDIRWGSPEESSGQYRFDTSVSWDDLKYIANTTPEIKDVLQ